MSRHSIAVNMSRVSKVGLVSVEMRFPAKIRFWIIAWFRFPKNGSQVLVEGKPQRSVTTATLKYNIAILLVDSKVTAGCWLNTDFSSCLPIKHPHFGILIELQFMLMNQMLLIWDSNLLSLLMIYSHFIFNKEILKVVQKCIFFLHVEIKNWTEVAVRSDWYIFL